MTQRKSFTVHEIAKRNGISHVTVYKLINSGQLRSFKAGRVRRISDEAESDWIANAEAKAGSVLGSA